MFCIIRIYCQELFKPIYKKSFQIYLSNLSKNLKGVLLWSAIQFKGLVINVSKFENNKIASQGPMCNFRPKLTYTNTPPRCNNEKTRHIINILKAFTGTDRRKKQRNTSQHINNIHNLVLYSIRLWKTWATTWKAPIRKLLNTTSGTGQ